MLIPHGYLDRLARDLDRWAALGLVDPAKREAILADAAAHAPAAAGSRMAGVLALLGVLLMGAGAIAFVAANWDGMARVSRLAVLLGSMTAAFAGGGWFLTRGARPEVGHGLILLGVLLFGADIHLIAQTYQIQAHYPDGVLLWAGGALLTAALVPSPPALWLAFALFGLWSGQEMFHDMDIALHPPFLLAWSVSATVAAIHGWWRCLRFGLGVFAGWYAVTACALDGAADTLAAAAMVLPLALWLAGRRVPRVGDMLHGLGLLGVVICAAIIAAPMADIGEPGGGLAATGAALAALAAALWGRPPRLRLALAAAAALLLPLRLAALEALPPEAADWVLIVAFLGIIIGLAVLGARESCATTRRVAYTAFALEILLLYTEGTLPLLSLFLLFTLMGSALVVSALRLGRRS